MAVVGWLLVVNTPKRQGVVIQTKSTNPAYDPVDKVRMLNDMIAISMLDREPGMYRIELIRESGQNIAGAVTELYIFPPSFGESILTSSSTMPRSIVDDAADISRRWREIQAAEKRKI